MYSVYNNMLYFLKKENINIDKYKNKLVKAVKNIRKNYIDCNNVEDIELNILNFKIFIS